MSGTTPLPRKRLGRTRAATALAAAGALIMVMGGALFLAAPASADHKEKHDPPGQDKVGICHRTASETNRYVYLEIPADQANGHITGDSKQHNQQIVWPSDGTWRGVAHSAGDPVLDYMASGPDDCNDSAPPPPTDLCPNIEGDQETVPDGLVVDEDGNCVEPAETTDLCPNIEGDQETLPEGYQLVDGDCVLIAGEETIVPKPKPDKKPTKATDEPTVKGVEVVVPPAAAPTAVAAGIGGPTTGPLQTIAQMLVAGGMLLLMAGAWIGLGRRESGTHEA